MNIKKKNDTDWIVYLLECSDNTYYCGITNNLEKRLEMHNSGKGAKYTRGRCPVKLSACIDNLEKGEALRLERKVKQLERNKKINFLETYNKS